MKHNGAEIIIKMLEKRGIEIVTGIPGAANLLLYDVLSKSKIKHVLARHEQGAGLFHREWLEVQEKQLYVLLHQDLV